jgi:hypothetical protein
MDRPTRGRTPPPFEQSGPSGGIAGLFAWIGRRRSAVGAVFVVVAALVAGAWIWSLAAERVRRGAGSILEPDRILVEGVAEWVEGDLRDEALLGAGLEGPLLLDDPDLARAIARAFSMHPWVRQVEEVRLGHPPSAVVRIVCREPVAMVRVEGGLLPIDAEAVVLPSEGFTSEQAAAYPKITGIRTSPRGPPGTPWGDPLVEQAAVLASVVRPEWEPIGLVECRFDREGTRPGWSLVRKKGGAIRFGPAPGHETPGEPQAAVKVARLKRLATHPSDAAVDLTTSEEP